MNGLQKKKNNKKRNATKLHGIVYYETSIVQLE